MTIFLIRHAHAGSRGDWDGDDDERPLSAKGREQAQGLLARYGGEPVTRVLSSPLVRCTQTVAPIARKLGLEVEVSESLREGAPVGEALALLEGLGGTDAVLCSHGDVIPALVDALDRQGVKVRGPHTASKAGTYLIATRKGRPDSVTYAAPPS